MDMKNDEENQATEKKQQRPRMYDTLAMITTMDKGKNVQITTVMNSAIIGKLVKVSPYELEIEVKGRDGNPERLIVMKHFIATIKLNEGGKKI
jgi:preprotein translocase subunit YajC